MAGLPACARRPRPRRTPVVMNWSVCAPLAPNPEPIAPFMELRGLWDSEGVVGRSSRRWTASDPATTAAGAASSNKKKPAEAVARLIYVSDALFGWTTGGPTVDRRSPPAHVLRAPPRW